MTDLCNNNVGKLGNEEQGKQSLCYFLKNVIKSNTGIDHSASLIRHASRTIDRYPLVAEDSGSSERTTMHLLNRVTNKISCAIEVSANMASLSCIGCSFRNDILSFFNFNVKEAIEYVLHHPDYKDSVEGENEEFENLPGDEFDDQEIGNQENDAPLPRRNV